MVGCGWLCGGFFCFCCFVVGCLVFCWWVFCLCLGVGVHWFLPSFEAAPAFVVALSFALRLCLLVGAGV